MFISMMDCSMVGNSMMGNMVGSMVYHRSMMHSMVCYRSSMICCMVNWGMGNQRATGEGSEGGSWASSWTATIAPCGQGNEGHKTEYLIIEIYNVIIVLFLISMVL